MRGKLTMSEYPRNVKIKTVKGESGGLAKGLRSASNVNTESLPILKGHRGFQDCSVTSSGAIYQLLIFPVENNMYLIAHDGVSLRLFLIYPMGGHKHIFTFPDTMTLDVAKEKVRCVVYCGFDYGDNRGRRVIIYPLGYSATINEQTYELEGFLNLDDYCDYNVFHSATLHEKRIFGTDGQKIYASEVESLIAFLPSNTKVKETDPWAGTVHHDGMYKDPISGVISFGGNVYYFCRNSFGRVWGGGNPFRTEELYMIGTVDFRSVKVLEEGLYFLSEKGLMVYDGQKLRRVSDPLGIENFQQGIGQVYRGQYYLAMSAERDIIYTYSPQTDSWGCIPFSKGEITMMAVAGEWLYILSCINSEEYAVSRSTELFTGFSFCTQMYGLDSMASDKLIGLRICVDFSPGSSLSASLSVNKRNGKQEKYSVFSSVTGSGVTVLGKRISGVSGIGFALEVTIQGNATVGGYEILFAGKENANEF